MNTKSGLISLYIGFHLALIPCFASEDTAPDAPPIPSVEDRVRNAELIAFISVTNVTTSSYTNSAKQMVKVLTGDAVVERLLKGKQPKLLKVKQEIVGDHSASIQLREGNFLARLKPSGSFYVPCDYYGLGGVVSFGTESGDDDRVLWPECNSVAEAVTRIEQALKNTIQAAEQGGGGQPAPRSESK